MVALIGRSDFPERVASELALSCVPEMSTDLAEVMDSIALYEVIVWMEDLLGTSVPDELLDGIGTLEDLYQRYVSLAMSLELDEQ